MKKKKYLIYYLIFGLILTILGILIINKAFIFYSYLIYIILVAFTIIIFIDLFKVFLKKAKFKQVLPNIIINIALIIIFSYFKYSFMVIFYGLYLLLSAIIKFVNYYLLKLDNDSKSYRELLLGIIFFIISILLLNKPKTHLKVLLIIMGIYILIIGLIYLWTYFINILPVKYKNNIKIILPTYIDCLIPLAVLKNINDEINNNPTHFTYQNKKEKEKPDLEIFIHVTSNGANSFGHCDFMFNNIVYSYGNYDEKSFMIKNTSLIGDGILFTTTKEKYLPFCIDYSHKTIISFGIKLTKKEKQMITQELSTMQNNLITWKPTDLRKNTYPSLLIKKANAKIYKFKKGSFRHYFIVGNNCVSFVNRILGNVVLKLNGILTPGTYYNYLNDNYKLAASKVISKTIYNSISKNNMLLYK
jgi:uncharacterized membrane protein HdeD (DUF308 family)